MQIAYLADHPHLIPQLAELNFEQWGHLHSGETLEQRTRRLEASCGRGGVPTLVIAIDRDGGLLGASMLLAADMDIRPDLTPWLAGVYVLAEHRGRGYASALVRRIEAEAAAIGVTRLHLYTPDAMDLYAGLGWVTDERCPYLGEQVTVMSKRL